MLNNNFKVRYKEIPLAYYEIQPPQVFDETSQITLLHFHEEIEIIHITEGQAEIFIDGKRFVAKSGDSLFVSPMVSHRMNVLKGKFGYYCICFDGKLLGDREEAGNVAEGSKKLPPMMRNSVVAESVKNIAHLFGGDKKGRSYSAVGELYRIFGEIISANLLEDAADSSDGKFALAIFKYIKGKYSEQITSGDCAEHFYIDQSSFCRKFKKCFGTTFSNYLCSYRLERARQMLEEKNLSVSEVSNKAGYANTSYFIKKYRQAYGITPKQSMKKEKNL